jgi:hypothetical protein
MRRITIGTSSLAFLLVQAGLMFASLEAHAKNVSGEPPFLSNPVCFPVANTGATACKVLVISGQVCISITAGGSRVALQCGKGQVPSGHVPEIIPPWAVCTTAGNGSMCKFSFFQGPACVAMVAGGTDVALQCTFD